MDKASIINSLVAELRDTATTITANLNVIRGESNTSSQQCAEAMKEIAAALKQQKELLDQVESVMSTNDVVQ